MRSVPMLVLALAIVVPLMPTPSLAQQEERCFAETGFCISGNIRTYWEQNGGLAVFGFPISDQLIDTVEGTWTGPVQWFERDRLEDHSNEGNGVLAGRLGAQFLAQTGGRPNEQPAQNTPPGCSYFPETGHNICEPFLSYWRNNGGLERFGYPLTTTFEEPVALPGGQIWRGTVQYFERRRMEYHPENAGTQYEVLLGLLGTDLYDPSSNGVQGLRDTLIDYFRVLFNGQYAEAVRRYGGSYDQLRAWNPDVDPNDLVLLLGRGCTRNGLQCLLVRRIVAQRRIDPTTYQFSVEFSARDGGVLNIAGRTTFDYTLSTPIRGPITILELPPYSL